MNVKFSGSAAKNASSRVRPGLDFAATERVFAGLTFTCEHDRLEHDEQRFVTPGLLDGRPVSVVHAETRHDIRVVSFREAAAREARFCFEQVGS